MFPCSVTTRSSADAEKPAQRVSVWRRLNNISGFGVPEVEIWPSEGIWSPLPLPSWLQYQTTGTENFNR